MRGSSPRMTTGCAEFSFVMTGLVPSITGLVPSIHVFLDDCEKGVDGRDKPGHDGGEKQ
jgi:hypothetical protein